MFSIFTHVWRRYVNIETTEALISANFCERLLCYICQALSTRTAAIILVT